MKIGVVVSRLLTSKSSFGAGPTISVKALVYNLKAAEPQIPPVPARQADRQIGRQTVRQAGSQLRHCQDRAPRT